MPAYPITKKRESGRPSLYSKALEQWATDVAVWIQNYLLEHDRIATGKSIGGMVITLKENSVELSSPQSLAFALQGRKAGGFPPLKNIRQWIIDKKIKIEPDAKGKRITLNALAFLIGRKIAEEGTNPPKLVPQNLTAVISSKGLQYQKQIAEASAAEIQTRFINNFKRQKP